MATRRELLSFYVMKIKSSRLRDLPKFLILSPRYIFQLCFLPTNPVKSELVLCMRYFSIAESANSVLKDNRLKKLASPVEYASALKSIRRNDIAIQILKYTVKDYDSPLVRLKLSEALIEHGLLEEASAELNNISNDQLAPNDVGSKNIALSRIAEFTETPEIAVGFLKMRDEESWGTAERVRYLNLLTLCNVSRDQFQLDASRQYLFAPNDVQLLSTICTHFVNMNNGASTMALLINSYQRGNANIHFRTLQLAWQLGDDVVLHKIISQLLQKNMYARGIVEFISEREQSSLDLQKYMKDCRRWIAAQLTSPVISKENCKYYIDLIHVSIAAGYTGNCKNQVAAVRKSYPFLPDLDFAEACLALFEDNFLHAEFLLRRLVKTSPQMVEIYPKICSVLNRYPNKTSEIENFLAIRETHIPRYRCRDDLISGRSYSIENYTLQTRLGNRAEATRYRSNRQANKIVSRWFPQAYCSFSKNIFSTKQIHKHIGVIAWEGVSDEIRWAQNYEVLSKYADRVTISCEPRLKSILERSFPTINFVPIARNFPLRWNTEQVHRPEIEDYTFSGVIDGAYKKKLMDCDIVMFSDEITFQLNAYKWQKQLKMLSQRGYLLPCPTKKNFWKNYFESKSAPSNKGQEIIGLLWNSSTKSATRNHHYLDLEDLLPLLGSGHQFVSLQPNMTKKEVNLCVHHGIIFLKDVDLFDDFEAVAAITSNLDKVIGISTMPFEMAGAVGTEVWGLAVSPEGLFQRGGPQRTDKIDQMTCNGKIFGPENEDFFHSRSVVIDSIVKNVFDHL